MDSNQIDREDIGAGQSLDVALSRGAFQTRMKTLNTRDLFVGTSEIGIEHGGSLYRLKITRQGKLILNK